MIASPLGKAKKNQKNIEDQEKKQVEAWKVLNWCSAINN